MTASSTRGTVTFPLHSGKDAMHIERIDLRLFANHRNRTIVFPSSGPLVITGDNGSGKTTATTAAIRWALWGEDYDAPGDVTVTTDTHTITRGKLLTFARKGEEPVIWKTKSTAEQQLALEVGDHDTWARTHTFSSDDVNFFARSTDGERKVFLEKLLGVGDFEPLHAAAKQGLSHVTEVSAALSRKAAAFSAAREAYLDAHPLEEVPKPKPLQLARVDASAAEAAASRISKLQERNTILNAQLEAARAGQCGACGQDVPPSLVLKLERERGELKQQYEQAKAARAEVEAEVRRQHAAYDAAVAEHRRATAAYDQYRAELAVRERAAEKAAEAAAKLADVQAEAAQVEADRALRHACVQALSTRGVRSWVVGQALTAITDLANAYLAYMCDLRVELSATTEKKGGGVSDAISFSVTSGGGQFKRSSQGQRQRISLAVRLAVASLKNPGTLFLDECFSNMDAAGVEGVVRLVHEISRTRCVVVITHDARLAKSLGGVHQHFA